MDIKTKYVKQSKIRIEDVIRHINQRIAYEKKYRLTSDYKNGWKGLESGPCCKKCKIDERKKIGNMMRLVGCKDPFQINCSCHISYRKVAVASELNLLEELKWYLEVRPDLI